MEKLPVKIGKYKIDSLIAVGGMGAVYKAIHPTLDRFVILKKLTLKGDKQIIQRFNREAKIMMDFKNDNIVDVYDHFEIDKSFYIVLEYIDGISLDKLIKQEEQLSNELAIYIVLEVSKALKYAHNKNVVHRDIKPANILISNKGEIKLVDFGIAQSDGETDEDLTTVGMTLGTPSYMAPEQFENSKFVDKRADIYSLGVVLYEMITGVKPYPAGLTAECISKIQKGRYKNPKKFNSNVNSTVSKLIRGLMHHKISKRVQDLDIILVKLGKYLKKERITLYKERLAESVLGDITKEIPVIKKKNRLYFIPIFLLLIISIYSYFNPGYLYEYLGSSKFGAVKIKLIVSKDYYKEIDEIYIKSKLFSEDGTSLNLKEDINFDLKYTSADDSVSHVYESEKIYLPVGFYRLKFIVDGNLFWKNINLSSLEQKGINLVTFIHKESEGLPFNPQLKVFDQLSGKDLTSEATIFIQKNGKFEKFRTGDDTLKTGQVQYFQFSKKGYYAKDYILKIAPDQTDLKLDAEIYPKPGILKIQSEILNVKLKVNDLSYYYKGDRSSDKIKLGKLKNIDGDLILNPGIYSLNFSYRGKNLDKEIMVKSGEEIEINIGYDSELKSLNEF